MRRLNLIGHKFTRLVVVAVSHYDFEKKKLYWLCQCECGQDSSVVTNALTSGNTQSCGCLDREVSRERLRLIDNTIHGHAGGNTRTPTYKSWNAMIQRTTNSRIPRWKDYGGRGITVCQRWRNFKNFLEDVGERPSLNHSIDRINNDLGYFKENCRWATRTEQQNNRRYCKKEVAL